jgi:GH25 family lysozyme M1 (1,4-beta-N-acetylmuramidase)
VAASGKRFAYIRASAGSLTSDARYLYNLAGAKAAGLVVGAYHYAVPDAAPGDAAAEAAQFLDNASPASGELLPALDLEESGGLPAADLAAWARTWLEAVSAAIGVKPVIYTSPHVWALNTGDTTWFADNGYTVLWVADWRGMAAPEVPAAGWGGAGWSVWQYSASGAVSGITGPVDLDVIAGTSVPSRLRIP